MPFNSPLGYWKWILSYTKMFLIILAVRWDSSLCYSYSTFEDALHSTDVVIEASLAKRCYAENSLGLFSFTRCHLGFPMLIVHSNLHQSMWEAKCAYLRKTVCEAAYLGARGPLRPADRRAPANRPERGTRSLLVVSRPSLPQTHTDFVNNA